MDVLRLVTQGHRDLIPALWDLLTAEEQARADALRFPADREESILSRGLLRILLAETLSRHPREIGLSTRGRGKPFLTDNATDLRFNVAHSQGIILFALAHGREVGVDIEAVTEGRPFLFFSDWTHREALVKAAGSGIFDPPPSIVCTVASLFPGAGYAASLAVEGEGLILKCRDWKPDKSKVEGYRSW